MSVPSDNPSSEREVALLSWIRQHAPYGVVTLDESFQVQTWNHWMELHSGKRFEDVVGKHLFTVYPDVQERRLVAHFERAMQGESSVLSTSLHRYLLPMPSPFRETAVDMMLQTARIAPLFCGGKVCGVVLVIEDVTQRESQADALGRQHRRDELLSWALAHLLKTEQPRKAVRQLFFKIAEHLDFDTFLIYLRDIETGQISLEAVGGVPVDLEKDFLACPFPDQLSGESQEPIVLNSILALPEPQYAALKKARISAMIGIPLCANDRNLGLLCFATWTRDSIGADEADLVKTIAQYLATSLDRENTHSQLRKAKQLLGEHAELLEKRVQERTARLRETISELETFSYTIAHDLRAPARSMSGFCEVMLEDFSDGLPPDARLVVQKIARASKRMEALTRDLLEFSKVSRQEIVLSAVKLEPIIEDLTTLRLPSVHEALTIRGPLHSVRAHQGLLQHIFSNLIDNAVKFVPPDKTPKITVSTEIVQQGSASTRSRPLVFSSTEREPPGSGDAFPAGHPTYVRIWVRDEGIGIPQEAHQKIFGIFERAASGTYEGTGMGLAIVARAMQRMGGTCGVESEVGKGSSFWLELPAA
ncbi:MAG TPA: ATP-binding protein [Patescibacteria group bacterium]|nr:ATP-binding protein [Patescibacteria group bacterium]